MARKGVNRMPIWQIILISAFALAGVLAGVLYLLVWALWRVIRADAMRED